VTICKWENQATGLSWDGDRIVFGEAGKGILRVSADGGEPQLIVEAKPGEWIEGPQLLNGGNDVLFTLATASGTDRWDKAQVVVQSLVSGKRKVVWSGGSSATYVPSDHLVFTVGRTVMAIAFDPQKLAVHGGPVPILDGVTRAGVGAQYAISKEGSLVYIPGGSTTEVAARSLALVDRNGKVQSLGVPPRPYSHPRIAPDGKRIVVSTDDDNGA